MPFFSIVIPVYKVEKYLKECVDSVLTQSFIDYEIILVDDGSPDNCPKICDNYAKNDKRIQVIHKENKGGKVADARNEGIRKAKGEYLVNLDGDDKFSNNDSLRNLFSVIQKYKTNVVLCLNVSVFTDNGEPYIVRNALNEPIFEEKPRLERFNGYDKNLFIGTPKEIIDDFEKNNKSSLQLASWSVVTNREYFISNDLFFRYGLQHEDAHWIPRVLFKTQQISINHSLYYSYRYRDYSTTTSFNFERVLDILLILDDFLLWVKDEKNYTKDGCEVIRKNAETIWEYMWRIVEQLNSIDKEKSKNIIQERIKNYTKLGYVYFRDESVDFYSEKIIPVLHII
jgi:glycosyltransferase involved in cell wall biosynthesis